MGGDAEVNEFFWRVEHSRTSRQNQNWERSDRPVIRRWKVNTKLPIFFAGTLPALNSHINP
jgi:hypothetical protein